jgi:hypothetical protein
MNCLIVNVQESVWKEMQRGFNTTTRDAVELLISKGFSLYVFDKNLRAIYENINTVTVFRECLKHTTVELQMDHA